MTEYQTIKAIIGLGNPGPRFYYTRHTIGFRIIDTLADRHQGAWHSREEMEVAEIEMQGGTILLIKPQTFMNASGRVIPFLQKKGITSSQVLVVHDELEKSLGSITFKMGGSARGHNGVRSIIEAMGPDFLRLRFGIGRPEHKEEVSDYVLQKFEESSEEIAPLIERAVIMIEQFIEKPLSPSE